MTSHRMIEPTPARRGIPQRRRLRAIAAVGAVSVLGIAPAAAAAEKFGRMFPKLPAFTAPSEADLRDLAAAMLNPKPDPIGTNRGTADDSSGLPSEFTYLGQFADHDLTFDPTPQPTKATNPSSITNGRTFRFDLDSVFGAEPSADPRLYASDRKHLLLADPNSNGVLDYARNPDGTATINEPRNDENQIISQIGTAFYRFYNRLIDRGYGYVKARRLTTDYWQEIVLRELLPAFVGQAQIDSYLHVHAGHYVVVTPNFPHNRFTPIEFSLSAYRFGHALVRAVYHINDNPLAPITAHDDNVPLFDMSALSSGDLTGGAPLPGPTTPGAAPAGHQIEWKYFVPALNKEPRDAGINFARKTQPTVSAPLFFLPPFTIPGSPNGTDVLLLRDFLRSHFYGEPSGQSIARALRLPVIAAASINPTHDASLNQGTPLLYYVLAEAQRYHSTLGPVGRAIVAQTFLRVLADDPHSILHNGFKPDPALIQIDPHKKRFTFGDLLVDAGVAPRYG
jgi:hypothetical protein